MPGETQAICQSCRILLPCSCSGWLGWAIFFSHQLPAEVVGFSPMMQVRGPLHLSSLFLRLPISSFCSSMRRTCLYLLLWATVPCWLLCSVFSFPTCAPIRSCKTSFALRIEASNRPLRPPAWDLSAVLTFLNSPLFEPLQQASLRDLTKKILFLLALATAKRVRELQAVSRAVSFVRSDACFSYVPEFVTKTESLSNLLPRSFLVDSLSDFAAGLEDELLLCPVRALRLYLDRTSSFSPLPRHLFLALRRPSRALSKNAISFFLCEEIHGAGTGRPEVGSVRAHSIRGVSTSAAFHQSWSVASVLESATWRSNSVFASFYLRDLQHEFEDIHSWLQVSGSVSSHLFPLCAGGGGETSGPLFLYSSRLCLLFGIL